MRRIACIALMLLVLTSCKTTKQTSENINQGHSSNITNVTSEELLKNIETRWNYSRSEQNEWGSLTTLIIYDTSKPADPETGRHPIYAEYSRRDSATSSTITAENKLTCDSTQIISRDSANIQERDTLSKKTKTSTKTTPLSSTTSFKIIIALLLIIGALIAYLKYKQDG